MGRDYLFIIVYIITFQSIIANGKKDITFPKAEKINEYTTRIPFKLIDHLIVVEAELMNKKGNFIIDTGSYSLILNKVHFKTYYQHYKKRKKTHGVIGTIDNPEKARGQSLQVRNGRRQFPAERHPPQISQWGYPEISCFALNKGVQ